MRHNAVTHYQTVEWSVPRLRDEDKMPTYIARPKHYRCPACNLVYEKKTICCPKCHPKKEQS
jgi:hypothetical protein